VIEHPEASHAWRAFGLRRPPREGGWIAADLDGGFTCCVEQGHYGHRARKATWLYAKGMSTLPSLRWGSCGARARLDHGYHSAAERAAAVAAGTHEPHRGGSRLTAAENLATPVEFRDLLIGIAESVPVRNGGLNPAFTYRRFPG
jgi:hypothetical protein